MKKLTKQSLDELAKVMPVLSEEVQSSLIGGGDGSANNPYSVQEFDEMSASGTWTGGYVEGWGYTASDTIVRACSCSCHGWEDVADHVNKLPTLPGESCNISPLETKCLQIITHLISGSCGH